MDDLSFYAIVLLYVHVINTWEITKHQAVYELYNMIDHKIHT